MLNFTLNVFLPDGWYEVPDERPRAFRPGGDDSGWLRISLYPPLPELAENPEAVLADLQRRLTSPQLNLGRCIHASHGPCTEGIVAFSLWKSPSEGFVKFWLIPSRVTVFATYTMGTLGTVERELADAHSILESVHLTEGGELSAH